MSISHTLYVYLSLLVPMCISISFLHLYIWLYLSFSILSSLSACLSLLPINQSICLSINQLSNQSINQSPSPSVSVRLSVSLSLSASNVHLCIPVYLFIYQSIYLLISIATCLFIACGHHHSLCLVGRTTAGLFQSFGRPWIKVGIVQAWFWLQSLHAFAFLARLDNTQKHAWTVWRI